jgi:hypothetical protein
MPPKTKTTVRHATLSEFFERDLAPGSHLAKIDLTYDRLFVYEDFGRLPAVKHGEISPDCDKFVSAERLREMYKFEPGDSYEQKLDKVRRMHIHSYWLTAELSRIRKQLWEAKEAANRPPPEPKKLTPKQQLKKRFQNSNLRKALNGKLRPNIV